MAREFTAYVVVRDPRKGENVTFEPGQLVPEWLSDRVGDHAAVSEGTTREVQTSEAPVTGDVSTDESSDTTEAITPDEDADDDDDLTPYEEWNKEDLKAEAKGRELTGYSRLNHEELVELLQADDAENPED